jgi:hypothetical protein
VTTANVLGDSAGQLPRLPVNAIITATTAHATDANGVVELLTKAGPLLVKLPIPLPQGATLQLQVISLGGTALFRLISLNGQAVPHQPAGTASPLPAAALPPIGPAERLEADSAAGITATLLYAGPKGAVGLPADTSFLVRITSVTLPDGAPPAEAPPAEPQTFLPVGRPIDQPLPSLASPQAVRQAYGLLTPAAETPFVAMVPLRPEALDQVFALFTEPAAEALPPTTPDSPSLPAADALLPAAPDSAPAVPSEAAPAAPTSAAAAPPPPTPLPAGPPEAARAVADGGAGRPAAASAPAEGILRPPAAPPAVLAGVVAPNTHAGQPLVQTDAGLISLDTDTELVPGSRVELEIIKGPPPSAATMKPPAATSMGGWAALDEATEVLGQAVPAAALQVARQLPQPGPHLAPALIALVAAIDAGNLRWWLGDGPVRALEEAGRGDLVNRLGQDLAEMKTPVRLVSGGDWISLMLPLFFGQRIERIRLMLRRPPEDDEEAAAREEEGARFLVDVDLSRLGPLQLDGLVKRRAKRFDLILRSHKPLPEGLRAEIGGIFAKALDGLGMVGKISFLEAVHFVEAIPTGEAGKLGLMI